MSVSTTEDIVLEITPEAFKRITSYARMIVCCHNTVNALAPVLNVPTILYISWNLKPVLAEVTPFVPKIFKTHDVQINELKITVILSELDMRNPLPSARVSVDRVGLSPLFVLPSLSWKTNVLGGDLPNPITRLFAANAISRNVLSSVNWKVSLVFFPHLISSVAEIAAHDIKPTVSKNVVLFATNDAKPSLSVSVINT